MIDQRTQSAFVRMTLQGAGEPGLLAAGLRSGVTALGLRALAAKLLHVAAVRPTRLIDVYDCAATAWTGGPVQDPTRREAAVGQPGEAFWEALWRLLAKPMAERRSATFTAATAELAGLLHPDFNRMVAANALMFPGVQAALKSGRPATLDTDSLAKYPPSSLGGAVHRDDLIRGRPSAHLPAEALNLEDLPAPLGYLNTHVLYAHNVWATVAGYSPAVLDEVALAAFKMGQFGHHHSSIVVAVSVATLAFDRPPGLEIVLESIFRGWLHGRATPPLLGVAWEELWGLPLETVREALGVKPFDSPLGAALRLLESPRGKLH